MKLYPQKIYKDHGTHTSSVTFLVKAKSCLLHYFFFLLSLSVSRVPSCHNYHYQFLGKYLSLLSVAVAGVPI